MKTRYVFLLFLIGIGLVITGFIIPKLAIINLIGGFLIGFFGVELLFRAKTR